MRKAVTILSGGMDSATLAFAISSIHGSDEEDQITQHFISFNYGQKHKKELLYAAQIARLLNSKHDIIDISSITPLLKGSSLTDDVEMPEGFYAEENMRLTVVPNRNAMMLSMAWAVAIAEKADMVYYGAHHGDHYIYPDCRSEFVSAISDAFRVGTYGEKADDPPSETPQMVIAPFINIDKAEILKRGLKMGVPYELTWTCYKGGDIACGVCGSCQERLEAFHLNDVEDPLPYVSRKLIKKGESVRK
jgi:7-cyano-7-deazaguanine synthase